MNRNGGTFDPNDPHGSQTLLLDGAPLETARAAMIMVHGRGASAEDILSLAPALEVDDVAFIAPQAAGNTWYPYSFMSPIPQNEPGISSGMRVITSAIDAIVEAGITPDRIILLGFSQGACLASEYAARHARRYGGVAVLSGGLIGPDATPRNYAGSFEQTPVFFGCSDIDPHIPAVRVRSSAEVLEGMGGDVTLRLYPRMGHAVNQDEIDTVKGMVDRIPPR